jgi:hypothetical protein
MKTQIRISILAITAFAASIAGAESLYQIGDTPIHFVGGAALISEDNIYRQSQNEVSDWRVEFNAGLEFSMANAGAANSSLLVSNRWVQYDTEPLNNSFLTVKFNSVYDSGVVLSNVYASYLEDYTSNDMDVSDDVYGVIVLRDMVNAGGNIRYDISELTAMKVGVDYANVDYDSVETMNGQTINPYSGHDSITIPVTMFYRLRPKVDLTAGLRYRQIDTDSNVEYTDMYYHVGAIGELFSPVIHADVSVGWQDRNAKGNDADASSASYKASLIYTGDPKSTIYTTVARDYRTSAIDGQTYAFTSVTLGGKYSISNTIGVNAALVYGESEYEESLRAEDVQIARLGVSYSPNDYLTVDAAYFRRDVDGNFVNYTSNEYRVSASLRY